MAERTKTKRISAKRLIDRTVQYYLESGDFNGLSLDKVFGTQTKKIEGIKEFLKPLIGEQRITDRCDEVDTNPFKKRMADLPPDREVARLNEWKGGILTAYPTQKEMALGAAWLNFRAFDLGVLEQYRNDPRYYYQVSDTHGSMWVHHEHGMKESDKVFLEHFGFAYDDAMNRAVAVFLTDLRKLSPEHQRLWEARRLDGKFKLHPIFWKTQVKGIRVNESVVTDAILWEMHQNNEYSKKWGDHPFFTKLSGKQKDQETFVS